MKNTISAAMLATSALLSAGATSAAPVSCGTIAGYACGLITFPGSTQTAGNDINDAGTIVGRFGSGPSTQHGYIVAAPYDTYQQIDPPTPLLPAGRNGLTGISNSGVVVGEVNPTQPEAYGFLRHPAGNFPVPPNPVIYPGAVNTQLGPIKDDGLIIGSIGLPLFDHRQSFVHSGGVYGAPIIYNGDPNTANALYAHVPIAGGEIAIAATVDAGGVRFAALLTGTVADLMAGGGTFTPIDLDPFVNSTFEEVSGLNDLHQIAGSFIDGSGKRHGYVADLIDLGGGALGVANFVQIDMPGAVVTLINAVNNYGQIVGNYQMAGEEGTDTLHAFLLTPVPEPGAIGMLCAMLMLFGGTQLRSPRQGLRAVI